MSDKLHYHLIAIGGVGMSAIASVLHSNGHTVSGSDRQESDITRRLRAAGMTVSIGHAAENVRGADVVVYSGAIPQDNPEMVEARRLGLEILERPAMLGRLMEPYQHRIAISGTHGKTTTTSMVAAILDKAEVDATVLIGGDLASMGGNARVGSGSVIVTEACEHFASFLHLHPSVAVITNIDADHLDYYSTVERVEEAFAQFVSQVDPDGCVIACWDDPRVRRVVEGCGRRVVTFGLHGRPDLLADRVDISSPEPTYSLIRKGEALGGIRLGAPGEQNVIDSLAAAAVAFELSVGFAEVQSALRDFRGAGRRFEVLYDDGGITVVDDYAHHPVELATMLRGARAAYDKHIIAVFQPHMYTRTRDFQDEFAEALVIADEVIVTGTYAAREEPIPGVTAENIVKKIREDGFADARYVEDKDVLPAELAERVKAEDMVIVIGAGDIRSVGDRLACLLAERARGNESR